MAENRVNGVSYNFPILIRGPLTPSTIVTGFWGHLVGVDITSKWPGFWSFWSSLVLRKNAGFRFHVSSNSNKSNR